ncbi:MAG: terminase, partial [Candidatus Zixiibacteriota bacterium]
MIALPDVRLPQITTGPFDFSNSRHAKRKRTLTFREYIQRVNPRFKFYRHIEKLIAVLQRVADGEINRLMVFMPPRHGKSETVSRLFSAYYLYKHPERWVGINSYAAELAYTLSRNARENYVAGGGALKNDAAAVKHWETGKNGGLWAAGVGGPITGKGFHLGIIDDPLKNAEEAASDTIRAKQKDWYRSTFST